MFCAKCGAQISAADSHCPKCGAVNMNFAGPSENQKKNWKKRGLIAGIMLVVLLGALSAGIFLMRYEGSGSMEFSPHGLRAYFNEQDDAIFLEGTEIVTVEGPAEQGRSSPDHTKMVVLKKDGTLILAQKTADEEKKTYEQTVIAADVPEIENIELVCNHTCYYTAGMDKNLYAYEFETGKNFDTGIKNSELWFSSGGNTVAAVAEDGLLSLFTCSDHALKEVCSVENADQCCVADDGSNVVWGEEKNGFFSIYMLVNGAPERVGELRSTGRYSYVYGNFFDDGKSFVAASPGSPELLLCKDGELKTITFPGVCSQSMLMDGNWRYVDSENDSPREFYIPVKKNKDSDQADIYRLSMDGSLVCELPNVNMNYMANTYSFRDGYGYFCDADHDFYRNKLDGDRIERVTTDVDSFSVSASGKYIFMEKSGSLYYWDTTAGDFKLNLITTGFSEDGSIYLTDCDDEIYYIADRVDIEDSYRTYGTLFHYKVGEDSTEIAEQIMQLVNYDREFFSASQPLIEKYISNHEYDHIVEYGTVVNGKYSTLEENIKD